jgi:hypothetical protein
VDDGSGGVSSYSASARCVTRWPCPGSLNWSPAGRCCWPPTLNPQVLTIPSEPESRGLQNPCRSLPGRRSARNQNWSSGSSPWPPIVKFRRRLSTTSKAAMPSSSKATRPAMAGYSEGDARVSGKVIVARALCSRSPLCRVTRASHGPAGSRLSRTVLTGLVSPIARVTPRLAGNGPAPGGVTLFATLFLRRVTARPAHGRDQ